MIEKILPMLHKAKHCGDNSYTACCPAHDDKHPSFKVTELQDGRILMYCRSGCDIESIVSALGMSVSDLYPDTKVAGQYRHFRSLAGFSVSQKEKESIEHEKRILNICKNRRSKGERLSTKDLERERQAFLKVRAHEKNIG